MNLAAKMLIFMLVTIILMAAGASYLVYQGGIEALKKREIFFLEELSAATMDKIDRAFFNMAADIDIMVTSSVFESESISARSVSKRLAEFKEGYGYFASLSFFNTDRVRVADTSEENIGEMAPPHGFWEDLLEGKKSAASDVSFSPLLGVIAIYFATPVKNLAGEVIGYVVGRVPLAALDNMLQSAEKVGEIENYHIDLINKKGLMLYSNHNKEGVLKDDLSGLEIVKISKGKEDLGGAVISGRIAVFAREKGYLDYRGNGWTLVLSVPETEVYAPFIGISGWLIAYMIVIGGCALLASFFFARLITGPLRKLRRAAVIFRSGQFNQRVEVTSQDEIGKASEAFNEMAKRIERDTKKLEEELAWRKRMDEELKKYTSNLEVANKELEAFSYSVSHDLRAPLRSIDGFSQVLLEEEQGRLDDQGKDYLKRIRTAAQRMAQLIEDLLSLSRVSRHEIKPVTVDLGRIASEVIGELKETEPRRRVEFVSGKEAMVTGDAHLLRIAMENLLSNAWKFTGKRPSARIEFGVTQAENKEAYFVRDDGAGFDMSYADKLFGAFQRLHSEKDFPGTGIGLVTVKRIVNRHGGGVWAESEVGKGATFYFTLSK